LETATVIPDSPEELKPAPQNEIRSRQDEGLKALKREQQRLLDEITALDKDHEAGLIDQLTYGKLSASRWEELTGIQRRINVRWPANASKRDRLEVMSADSIPDRQANALERIATAVEGIYTLILVVVVITLIIGGIAIGFMLMLL
jgi:hypothetical protein